MVISLNGVEVLETESMKLVSSMPDTLAAEVLMDDDLLYFFDNPNTIEVFFVDENGTVNLNRAITNGGNGKLLGMYLDHHQNTLYLKGEEIIGVSLTTGMETSLRGISSLDTQLMFFSGEGSIRTVGNDHNVFAFENPKL